jgi:hypothetical protein
MAQYAYLASQQATRNHQRPHVPSTATRTATPSPCRARVHRRHQRWRRQSSRSCSAWATGRRRAPLVGDGLSGSYQAMRPWHIVINLRWAARMLAWTALVGASMVLALLLRALAASALVAPPSADSSTTCQSVAAAALADGEDVRARFRTNFVQYSCRAASKPLVRFAVAELMVSEAVRQGRPRWAYRTKFPK